MLRASKRKLPDISVGSTVVLAVPAVDKGPLDPQNILGKILDFRNGVYRVGTESGVFKNWFPRSQLQLTSAIFENVIPEKDISLREAVAGQSKFGGQGMHKCNCKPATNQCRTNRCSC